METLGDKRIPAFFSDNFESKSVIPNQSNENDFHIFEVDEHLMDQILNNKTWLKADLSAKNPEKFAAALITDTESYKVQRLGKLSHANRYRIF